MKAGPGAPSGDPADEDTVRARAEIRTRMD
jgi:hypothetical protein